LIEFTLDFFDLTHEEELLIQFCVIYFAAAAEDCRLRRDCVDGGGGLRRGQLDVGSSGCGEDSEG